MNGRKLGTLLGFQNAKTSKGESLGWYTGILYLAPADTAGGRTVCAHASAQCKAACLYTAGRAAIFAAVNAARVRKTREFFADRTAFVDRIAHRITLAAGRSARAGMRLAIRLNGTSDIDWQRIPTSDGRNLMERFPAVTFYDYTKNPFRRSRHANYDLTFSRSETNGILALGSPYRVAVVFDTRKGHALPAEYLGRPVVDGDLTDLRFLDPAGVVVGLRAKGLARGQSSGFVVPTAGLETLKDKREAA